MDNLTAFRISGECVCRCGAELVVHQSPTLGYYLKCVNGHMMPKTQRRPQRKVEYKPTGKQEDMRDLFA